MSPGIGNLMPEVDYWDHFPAPLAGLLGPQRQNHWPIQHGGVETGPHPRDQFGLPGLCRDDARRRFAARAAVLPIVVAALIGVTALSAQAQDSPAY